MLTYHCLLGLGLVCQLHPHKAVSIYRRRCTIVIRAVWTGPVSSLASRWLAIMASRWSSCSRQSVDQCVWVSGLSLGPLTTFYLALLSSSDNYFFLLSKAPSLTRKRICSLQSNHSLFKLLTPNNHTLPSHLRLCYLFVASYDSQGLRWRYCLSNYTRILVQRVSQAVGTAISPDLDVLLVV
jgi:hypothetical protein